MGSVKQLVRKLEFANKRLAKERDILRAIIDDSKDLLADCEEAHEDVERAVDALSRLN